jgi:hypothetical protein
VNDDRIKVNVVSNQNSVELTKPENKVIVTDKKQDTSVNVVQKQTSVVTVVSKGPKGDRGEQASLSGSVYITGSLEVSSSVTAQSFTGSLFGTASWAQNALTASYVDASNVAGLSLSRISTGSVTASVNVGDDTFRITSGSSAFLYVSSSGNIGIGTETPNATLNIAGTLTQGDQTIASGSYSHAEGRLTTASGNYSHAEGQFTTALGNYSHAEGYLTVASGSWSHAEGFTTIASGNYSHAEGVTTTAFGLYSHAEGYLTNALGWASHAEGYGTVALGNFQHTTGQFNISSSAQSAFIIGNGTSTGSRSNLLFASGSEIQITGSLSVSGSITSTNTFVQGGNSFGATALLGTNDNQNLQLETSGSVRVHIGNTGNVGIGTATPNGVIDVVQGGTSRILVTTDSGFVGLQQSSPAEYIHITSDPSSTKYLRIDAIQASNPPPRYGPVVPAKELYGQTADDFALGTPDYWMEIKLDGNIVLIPCYLPE